MLTTENHYTPKLSESGLNPTHPVSAVDEFGETRDMQVAGEFPLIIKVDNREIVTLMTLGTHPETLTLGYLRNQRFIEDLEDIVSVDVDWERELVEVETRDGKGIIDLEEKLSKRTVTTGCGQGTVFSCRTFDFRNCNESRQHGHTCPPIAFRHHPYGFGTGPGFRHYHDRAR